LGVAMGFVGNYAPRGLSPQTDGMPVIQKQASVYTQKLALIISFVSILQQDQIKRLVTMSLTSSLNMPT